MSRVSSPCNPSIPAAPIGSTPPPLQCRDYSCDAKDRKLKVTETFPIPTRTPSPSAAVPEGGEPPRKRRRVVLSPQLSQTARRFLDLEADDASSEPDEEGSDAGTNDFVDDSPLDASAHLHTPLFSHPQSVVDDAQDALDIAEAIRERERRRIRDALPPSVVQRLVMLHAIGADSLVNGAQAGPEVPAFVPLDMCPEKNMDPIPYLISITPNAKLEQKLIRWLRESVPGVVAVMSHELGSGRIYVSALHYVCLELGLDEWPLSWNLSPTQRKPQQLTPLEYLLATEHLRARQAVIESPPEHRPGTWARFRSDFVHGDDFTTLAGDLLLLLGPGIALTVPRINYTSEPISPLLVPPRLCFAALLIQNRPHTKNEIDTDTGRECWTWRKRCFRDSGLEVFKVEESEITVEGVEPTDEERGLFALSRDPLLCRPSLAPAACALQPGDRVVIRAPGNPYTGGRIQWITKTDDGVVMATVSPEDLFISEPVVPSSNNKDVYMGLLEAAENANAGYEKHENISVPLDQVRLHLLSTPRHLSRGDRVLVVGGPHAGTYGQIIELSGLLALSIQPSTEAPITVEMRHARVCFRLGDVVEVTRGEDRGVIGFIVAIYHGGYVDIYPCRVPKYPLVPTSSVFTLLAMLMQPPVQRKLQTLDIRLVPTETATREAAPSVIQPELAIELQHERDRLREAWEDDMRRMGNLLHNMEVRIVGKHQEKALYGTILDYRHQECRPGSDKLFGERLVDSLDEILADVELTIRLEGEGRPVRVRTAQVVERTTGLSVEHAALLKAQKLLHLFAVLEEREERGDPPIPAGSETDVAWGAASASNLPLVPEVPTAPNIGEETGLWLAHYQLIDKRVDVFAVMPQELEEINRRLPQLKKDKKINGKTVEMSRRERTRAGYLVPLTEGVPPSKVPGWSVWCKFPPSSNAKMCVVTLRPCRQTDIDREHPVAKCISTVRGRVIIIGPDVEGNDARLGDYAETIPGEDGLPTTLVNVRFPKTRDIQGNIVQPTGRYHLVCLCRALNRAVPGAEARCKVTDFNANPL